MLAKPVNKVEKNHDKNTKPKTCCCLYKTSTYTCKKCIKHKGPVNMHSITSNLTLQCHLFNIALITQSDYQRFQGLTITKNNDTLFSGKLHL